MHTQASEAFSKSFIKNLFFGFGDEKIGNPLKYCLLHRQNVL